MKRIVAVIFFLLGEVSTGMSQIPEHTIPGFDSLPKPTLREITPKRTKKGFSWRFASYEVTMTLPKKYFTVTFSLKPPSSTAQIFDSPFGENPRFLNPDRNPPKVYSFDADQNGHDDLFVVEKDWVSEGHLGSESPMIHAFFFTDDGIDFRDLCSIGGSVDLFRDFNHDGKYEFACIKYFGRPDSGRGLPHFGINIFGVRKIGNVSYWGNITDSAPGFPIIFTIDGWDQPEPRFHTLQEVPLWIRPLLRFDNCNSKEREY